MPPNQRSIQRRGLGEPLPPWRCPRRAPGGGRGRFRPCSGQRFSRRRVGKAPKTREITDALGRLGIAADTKILIILTNPSEVVRRSVRNLEKVKLISADQLNVFDLLNANSLVVGETALATIQEVYSDD